MTRGRERWRMTLEGLCHLVGRRPGDLARWATWGCFGPGLAGRPVGGWGNITRLQAQRAVVCARLVDAGVGEHAACLMAPSMLDSPVRRGPAGLEWSDGGVTVTVHFADGELP